MKIGIIGFNIFAAGGTTRSNLNLIHEFTKKNHEVVYYNYTPMNTIDIIGLQYDNPVTKNIELKTIDDLIYKETEMFDYFFITREAFFPLAKILRSKFPDAKIIGEIHAPLSLIPIELEPVLEDFSYIRVATESIKKTFMEKYNFKNVFVQTVSLNHVEPLNQISLNETNNIVIYSRFAENQKDISYAIKLMDYIVNYLNVHEIHLYINGYGIGEILYRNLIGYYGLKDNIHINQPIPDDYIYLSTARAETLGYSIIESIAKGHLALLYPGDDEVIQDIYGEFKTVSWINKNIEEDAHTLLLLTKKEKTFEAYDFDMNLLENLKTDYVSTFLKYTNKNVKFKTSPQRINQQLIDNILAEMSLQMVQEDELKKYREMYNLFLKIPVINLVVRNKRTKIFLRDVLAKWVQIFSKESKNDEKLDENHYFIESFHGKNFSGDPKHLALYIQKERNDATFFVSSANQLVDIEILSYGFIPLRIGSKEYQNIFKKCKYVIINGNSLDLVGKQSKQVFIQTWHGFPMKKMVNDLENLSERERESNDFSPRMKKWNYLLTSSRYNSVLFKSAFDLKSNKRLKVIELGAPRNAYLLTNKNSRREKYRIYWKYFNKPKDDEKRIVLFCPTWRKNDRSKVSNIDLKYIIDRLPQHYEIIVKLHPHEGKLRKEYAEIDDRIHCFYNELVDIQELYLISDMMISDYSSAIFDYAHLNKKIIIHQEDIEKYREDVGWYFDVEKACGLKGKNYTSDELIEEVLTCDEIDYDHHLIIERLLNKDSKDACQNIINKIN